MRNKVIDFLRGIAILLTLFHHFGFSGIYLFDIIKKLGWIGVDLFFVLSGFLVSGLIFDEYRDTNKFDGKRFLIRRGFKIYPSFWIYIIANTTYQYVILGLFDVQQVLRQFLFIQNYFYDNDHTWSLAVEEHFYFMIVIVFTILIKKSKNLNNTIIYGSLGIILYGILSKCMMFWANPDFSRHTHLFPTHLRIDALVVGLLIAHVWRTNFSLFRNILKYKYLAYTVVLCILILPLIWNINEYPQQLYMSSFGLTLLSFAFGILLILFLNEENLESNISKIIGKIGFKAISTIGLYSYSIYLWHALANHIMYKLFEKGENNQNGYFVFITYMSFSIFLGIFMGKTIEYPILKVRERYFPKKANKPIAL